MAKRAAGWPTEAPSPAQIKELFDQIRSGQVTSSDMQKLLENQQSIWPSPNEIRSRLRELVEHTSETSVQVCLDMLGDRPNQPEDPNEVIIPMISFEDPQREVRFIREILGASGVPFEDFLGTEDVEKIEYVPCVERLLGARWVTIDLMANKGCSTDETREKISADQFTTTELPILLATCSDQFKRFQKDTGVHTVCLSGYRLCDEDQHVLTLSLREKKSWREQKFDPCVELSVYESSAGYPVQSVPIRWE